eukprot:TRINITY_DN5657_c0_g1_i6.p2 TRINITY_DN5657_c0_g1~~TRINITY_DN5657_c0_g1_i6.p2  ORF type:complete len:503 (-),score=96.87 TRINITY_DN5657_c0_g1_i6:42-1550(-)
MNQLTDKFKKLIKMKKWSEYTNLSKESEEKMKQFFIEQIFNIYTAQIILSNVIKNRNFNQIQQQNYKLLIIITILIMYRQMGGIMEYNKWFPFETCKNNIYNSSDVCDVFCFSHAGGSASTYRKWTLEFKGVNFICVELPGIGTRRNEEFITDFKLIVKSLADNIEKKVNNENFYFYGHSMGAAIAFFTASFMLKHNIKSPKKIIVAGRQNPSEKNLKEFKTYMDDNALINELKRYNATPKEVLENEEFLKIIIPELRKAYKLNESFIYSGDKISIPIIAHAGKYDSEANCEIMLRWKKMTTNDFKIREFDGDHFFIFNNEKEYKERLIKDIMNQEGKVMEKVIYINDNILDKLTTKSRLYKVDLWDVYKFTFFLVSDLWELGIETKVQENEWLVSIKKTANEFNEINVLEIGGIQLSIKNNNCLILKEKQFINDKSYIEDIYDSFENLINYLAEHEWAEAEYNLIPKKPVSYTHLTLPTKRIVQISVVAVPIKNRKQKRNT